MHWILIYFLTNNKNTSSSSGLCYEGIPNIPEHYFNDRVCFRVSHYVYVSCLTVHGLYKIHCINSFVPTVSRHYPISARNVTKLYPPPRLTIGTSIRCMSKSMNIEDVKNMRVRVKFMWSWRNYLKKICRKGKSYRLSRGNLDFEKFGYFENTNFRYESAGGALAMRHV